MLVGTVARPPQSAVFSGLHSFWNGAAFIDATQALLYLPGQMVGRDWPCRAGVGAALVVTTHPWSVRKRRLADEAIPMTEEEGIGSSPAEWCSGR